MTRSNQENHISDAAQKSIKQAADIITKSKYTIAMTGAGMSVESGIPPFRGTNGLWTRYGTPRMDAYQQFKADPQAYWQRQINAEIDEHILELREALRNAKPHQGHYALANLVKSRTIKSVITQNIDGLDIKAGIRDNLIEIHGNRSRLRCIGCGKRTDLNDFVPLFAPDPCDKCGKPVKFDAVMFGEPIPDDTMQDARNQFERADCIITIGTSATVRPASGLLWIAKHRSKGQHDPIKHHIPDAKLIEINPNNTKLTKICDVIIRATAKHALPQILKALHQHHPDP